MDTSGYSRDPQLIRRLRTDHMTAF